MPLAKDNKVHRDRPKLPDAKNGRNIFYDKVASPLIQGTYHAGRYIGNGCSPADLERFKDQFSKLGTEQKHLDYLKVLCESEGAKKAAANVATKVAEKAAEEAVKAAKKGMEVLKKAAEEAIK